MYPCPNPANIKTWYALGDEGSTLSFVIEREDNWVPSVEVSRPALGDCINAVFESVVVIPQCPFPFPQGDNGWLTHKQNLRDPTIVSKRSGLFRLFLVEIDESCQFLKWRYGIGLLSEGTREWRTKEMYSLSRTLEEDRKLDDLVMSYNSKANASWYPKNHEE